MAKPQISWAKDPNYNPRALIEELKTRRHLRSDAELADLLGVDRAYLREQARGARPIGFAMLLYVVYEYTELNLDQIFWYMGIRDASIYLTGG